MNFAHPHLSPAQIQTMDWLAVLNAEQQAYVASTIEVTAAAPGDVVCRSGQQPTHWIGVVQGLVKMSENAANGRTVTFAGFPPGGWFGEGTLLEEGRYRYEIQSLQDSVLAQLPATVFHRLLRESIGFNQFLMRQFNQRLGQFIAYKAAEHTLPLEQQLARCSTRASTAARRANSRSRNRNWVIWSAPRASKSIRRCRCLNRPTRQGPGTGA